MIEQAAGSRRTILAIREAERIIGRHGEHMPELRWKRAALDCGRGVGRGLAAAGFLTLCFLPAMTVLGLVALAIFLAR